MGYFLKPVNRQLTERISYVYMDKMFSMHGAIYGGYEPFVKFPSGSYSVSCVGRREEAARKQYVCQQATPTTSFVTAHVDGGIAKEQ